MTLREFDIYVRGYTKRIEHGRELLAWHAANLMNCWVKKKVTVDRLLGRGEAQPQTFDEMQQMMRERQRQAELSSRIDFKDGDIEFRDPDEPISFHGFLDDDFGDDTLDTEER